MELYSGELCHSGERVYGNLIIANNGSSYIIPSSVFEPDGHHLRIDSDEPFWVDVESIRRNTGEADGGGKMIFEKVKLI